MEQDYLKISRSSDLKNPKERFLYRLLEIFPGALAWGALILVILLSWLKPAWIAVFVIALVLYWFFRSVYFSFYLKAGYKKMREHEKTDWLKKLEEIKEKDWQKIYHLVILPVYKESFQILRDTLLALEKTDFPKEKIMVVLSFEERGRQETQETAKALKKEFEGKFFKLFITWHPAGLPGEIPGHGSNDAWAGRQAKEKLIDPLGIPYENVIVSSFDSDTCVFPKYFSCLTYHYLTSKNPTRTAFQPIPLYINNIWQSPPFSRVFAFSSTFWHTMNQERPEKLITFSSHAMSFKTLVDVGFKQPNVISDDSRIFWQCFLKYDGDFQVAPLYYPVSMDANCAENFLKTAVNIYKQQRRWAFGSENIPYFLFGFLKNKKIPLSKKLALGLELIEGHFSWATASIMIFLLGWLPLVLGGAEFSQTLMAYNLPKLTSQILTVAMLGLVSSAYLSILLLPPRPPNYGKRKYFILATSWLLLPIMMIFFTALPALDSQTRLMRGKYPSFWPTKKVRFS